MPLAERACLKQPWLSKRSQAGPGSLGKFNIPPFPGGGFLTWQRQVALWVALRLGQTAVLAAAVLQDLSSGMQPVLWSNRGKKKQTVKLMSASNA